ncbi:uncharacterized protein LOC144129496 [Amblyomma americanum]
MATWRSTSAPPMLTPKRCWATLPDYRTPHNITTKLTPVHQRPSRRIRGESPEFGPLPPPKRTTQPRPPSITDMATDTGSPAPTQPSPVSPTAITTDPRLLAPILWHPPRTPPSFHGDVFEDAEDWLQTSERVAHYNGWSDERKLHNVYFALEESPRTWFENHETTLPTWETFCQNLLATFLNADRREKAEAALHSRNQHTNESVPMYIEDMALLFKRADPNMTEEKKLHHLMRGVKQELFAGLVRSPPRTVAEFLTEAATIETTLQQRVRQYNRDIKSILPETISSCLGASTDALRELIRSVIREELQRFRLPQVVPGPLAALTEVVGDEMWQVEHALPFPEAPPQFDARPTYAFVVRRSAGYGPATPTPAMSSIDTCHATAPGSAVPSTSAEARRPTKIANLGNVLVFLPQLYYLDTEPATCQGTWSSASRVWLLVIALMYWVSIARELDLLGQLFICALEAAMIGTYAKSQSAKPTTEVPPAHSQLPTQKCDPCDDQMPPTSSPWAQLRASNLQLRPGA